ncbi:heme anaerobic degradation radical SAM methyltransferase ChuW/HutW [Moritella sp.]|uniref:heme anaerobic degradation radical SAM methyltransferase ChuW/HutW n=1 Tax=Moritella sp. TaxID=78556 RepID=UPI001E120F57|nr:heme anaerobic degradation radical SAM methyltransferase ChuW/HutW [Moritella sp.]MCJ8351210.1 heme anaerobic degradation radical SAM methyltransferase ChuW/HutW [Moritella sp.]NQZ41494.1 heme anaerobic degradation radical SAM methyltransferase ChuW/HutW [Moritella sp.]
MIFTPTMTGISTPEPLKFAFTVKTSAHAGRAGSRPLMLDQDKWEQWWSIDSSAETRALYIHIPFCRKRCSFCNFFENGAKPSRVTKYVDALCKQLADAASTQFILSKPFDTVYIGGGTPTDMQANEILQLANVIQSFPLKQNAEITLEGRINGFTNEKFEAALSGGINRFSFGVQSVNTEVRQAAGRFDDEQTLLQRLSELAKHPKATIVADLIFGLPGQTFDTWMHDVQAIIDSGIHGVDLYQLINLPNSRIDINEQKHKFQDRADTQERAVMYAAGAELLEQHGWDRLSNCHWRSHKREESLYNTLAKQGVEIVPFGAGAGGSIHGHGVMNARDLKAWHNANESGIKVPGMVMSVNDNAQIDGIIKKGFDKGMLALDELPVSLRDHLQALFVKWGENGLIELDNNRLNLTLAGRFWNVNMLAGLFEYLATNPLLVQAA